MKKIIFSRSSLIFVLAVSFFSFACDNKSRGHLMPSVENGINISDTQAKNDTANGSFDNLKISVFGNWNYEYTKPPNGKNERASFSFTYTIENNSESDLILNLGSSQITNDRIEKSRQVSVTELVNSKESGLTALSVISSETVTIKSGEKRIFEDYFLASLKDEGSISKDEIIYKSVLKDKDFTIKFKCIPNSEIEYIQNERQRPEVSKIINN